MEWVLSFDGPSPTKLPACRARTTVVASPTRQGVSAARNRALLAARGTWVVNLDDDDTLIADGVCAVADAVGGAELGWVGAVLLQGGVPYPALSVASSQVWRAGQLVDEWTVPMAFHPGTAWMRRDVLLAVGGWPALGWVEDKLPVFSVSELTSGLTVPEATHQYRRHPGQVTNTAAHKESREYALKFTCDVLTARRRLTDPYAAPVQPQSLQ